MRVRNGTRSAAVLHLAHFQTIIAVELVVRAVHLSIPLRRLCSQTLLAQKQTLQLLHRFVTHVQLVQVAVARGRKLLLQRVRHHLARAHALPVLAVPTVLIENGLLALLQQGFLLYAHTILV